MSYEDEVLTAVADSLAGIDGLQQSAYVLPNPTMPAAEILPGVIEFDETFGTMSRFEAVIRVTVGDTLSIPAQRRLRAFRAPTGADSIKAAVEADRTLGGLTSDLNVNRASPVRNFRRPDGSTSLGCDFEIEFEGEGDG